jgi:multidrug efflux pump subunit AcrA (membrane-fusion protein)
VITGHAFRSVAVGWTLALLAGPPAVQAQPAPEPLPERIYTVTAVGSGAATAVGGTVVPRQEVTLSAQLPGRVESIAGSEGDRFEAGARLVQLSIQDLLAQRQSAQAQVASADAALRNASVQYGQELVSPQVGQSMGGMGMPNLMDQMIANPMSSFIGARQPGVERGAQIHARGTQIEQARQALSQAVSRLQEIDARIRDSKSVAPFSGVITAKLVEIGDTVQPGQPLLTFADPTDLQVQADIPARLVAALREGLQLAARLDVGQGYVPVRVARIFPTADPVRHTVRVKLDLAPGTTAAPGTYAEVMLPDAGATSRPILAIPRSAVVSRGGLTMVFAVTEDSRADLRFVRLGEPVGPDLVRVLSGLQAGDRIVREPAPGLTSGVPITP